MTNDVQPFESTRDARRDYLAALRACKPYERAFIKALVEHRWQPFAAGAALGISRSMVQRVVARPRVRKAMQMMNTMAVETLGVTSAKIIAEYSALAFSRVGDFFSDDGAIRPISEWSDEMHAQVLSLDVDELSTGEGEARRVIGFSRKLKLHSKKDSLDALARMQRLAVDRGSIIDEPERAVDVEATDAELARFVYRALKSAQPRPIEGKVEDAEVVELDKAEEARRIREAQPEGAGKPRGDAWHSSQPGFRKQPQAEQTVSQADDERMYDTAGELLPDDVEARKQAATERVRKSEQGAHATQLTRHDISPPTVILRKPRD